MINQIAKEYGDNNIEIKEQNGSHVFFLADNRRWCVQLTSTGKVKKNSLRGAD